MLLSREFWSQGFVRYAILAEFSLGMHDLMLSGCSYKSGSQRAADTLAGGPVTNAEDSVESFEFFVWSRGWFVATFAGLYLFTPSLNAELRELLSGKIGSKYVLLSAISEGLTILGFYLASIAYGLFYQAGVVHAAEASLSQLFNLMLAFVLLRGFGIGRISGEAAGGRRLGGGGGSRAPQHARTARTHATPAHSPLCPDASQPSDRWA